MVDSIDAMRDILKLAKKVSNKKSINLNTGVYGHLDEDDQDEHELTPDKDIITIRNNDGITVNDICKAVNKIIKQFRTIDGYDIGRSYDYEGIIYNSGSNTYELQWGS